MEDDHATIVAESASLMRDAAIRAQTAGLVGVEVSVEISVGVARLCMVGSLPPPEGEGPRATREDLAEFRRLKRADEARSAAEAMGGRRLDLAPFDPMLTEVLGVLLDAYGSLDPRRPAPEPGDAERIRGRITLAISALREMGVH